MRQIKADFVMLHCTKKKKLYQKIKELEVNEEIKYNKNKRKMGARLKNAVRSRQHVVRL